MLASAFAGLYVLAALACPVGMGVMMVFMGRGMRGGKSREQASPAARGEESLSTLKAEQARLAEKIAALEERAGERSEDAQAAVEESERTPA